MWTLTQLANGNKWYNHHIFERIGIPVSKVYFIAVGAPLAAKYNLSSYRESVFLQTAMEHLCTGGFVLKPLGCDGSSGVQVMEELCSVKNDDLFMERVKLSLTSSALWSLGGTKGLGPHRINCAHAYDSTGKDVRVGYPLYGIMMIEKYKAAEGCSLIHTAPHSTHTLHIMPARPHLHHFKKPAAPFLHTPLAWIVHRTCCLILLIWVGVL